jgi:hypothetical protein
MKFKIFTIVLPIFIFCSWTLQQHTKIKKAAWLTGTWENKTQRGSVYETWTKLSEVEFSGKSYMLKDQDTIVFETVRLIQEQNNIFYIPQVKGQNEGLPVRFRSTIISDKELVFENQEHEFPQLISYTKINADSLVARISGTKNGKERQQQFRMKRVK